MRAKPRRVRFHPLLSLRRQPRLWWALTAATALAVGWAMSTIVADAEAVRAAWGPTTLVVVARHDIAVGTPVAAGDVELVERPRALVPEHAVRELPRGQLARDAIAEGEVVVDARLAPLGLAGVAALLPAGSRAVAIPVEVGLAPPVLVGDRVDVLVALAPELAGDGPPGFVIAAGALVVAVDPSAVTVAVDASAAPRIAVALGQGAVTLALRGGA